MSDTRSPDLVSGNTSCLVLIDMQEKLVPSIDGSERIIQKCGFLLEVAALLGVPLIVTEQYPKGLGRTVAGLRLAAEAAGAPVFEKLRFSAAEVLEEVTASRPGLRQVVLAGIETHICVLQTALDLQAAGLDVILATDATGSRNEVDRAAAMSRLAAAGVVMATVETIAFEWCETAEHPAFRQLSGLVRSQAGRG
ncbi:MAG: Vibriobactin-specific isochorismatase [Planctomycetota bacterium]